jgi:thiol-disulfide isomerase/thioredoxin
MIMKKYFPYLWVLLVFFALQYFQSRNLRTGEMPTIIEKTMRDETAESFFRKGPGFIYFWANWCAICSAMQSQISAVAADYPQLSIALRSGSDFGLKQYLQNNNLFWPVINDPNGVLAAKFGVTVVPTLFILNRKGDIVFTTVGYTSEWGLRLRILLAGLI